MFENKGLKLSIKSQSLILEKKKTVTESWK